VAEVRRKMNSEAKKSSVGTLEQGVEDSRFKGFIKRYECLIEM
jgi:hypothetical protein